MPDAITTPTELFGGHRPITVQVRTNWSDDWTPVQYLYADLITTVANPEIPRAELTYRYGEAVQPGKTTFDTYTRQSLVGKYVRIEVAGLGTWYGSIVELVDDRIGGATRGVERYIAWGLEFLLDLEVLSQSIVADAFGVEKTVDRTIPFNGGTGGRGGRKRREADGDNADEDDGDENTMIFADTFPDNVRAWDSFEILAYLLAYFPPQDKDGVSQIPWEIDDTSQLDALFWDKPFIDPEGKTLKKVLDELIGRQRGLGWKLVVDEGANKILIQVFTYSSSDIDLADSTFPANANQKTLDFDTAVNIQVADVRTSALQEYDQIIVRGNRRGSICTLAFADLTLEADWTATNETDYETAAADAVDYGDELSDSEKDNRNADVRNRDKLLRVFSWFQLHKQWTEFVGDGEGETPTVPAFPVLDVNGDPTNDSIPLWRPGLRFETFLPLLENHEYDADKIDVDAVLDNTPANSNAEQLPPIVLIRVRLKGALKCTDPLDPGGPLVTCLNDHYDHVETLSQEEDTHGGARSWACSVSIRDDDASLILKVHGAEQHFLARADFTKLEADVFDTDLALDFNTLIATVYMLGDAWIESRFPPDATVADGDVKRTLVIDVDDAYLDWVPKGTVVGIKDGVLQKVTVGAWFRDDRDRLDDIARVAWEWYGTKRKTLSLSYRSLTGLFAVGDLITQIGSPGNTELINTVITRIAYDLVVGTTQIETQFANLDVQGLF